MATDDPTTPPPDGWYWLQRPNGDLEVVQVWSGMISVIDGDDEGFRLEGWPDSRFGLTLMEGRLLGRIPEPQPGALDHADLLRRYVRLVVQEEGFDFLPRLGFGGNDVKFNDDELALLARLSEEAMS